MARFPRLCSNKSTADHNQAPRFRDCHGEAGALCVVGAVAGIHRASDRLIEMPYDEFVVGYDDVVTIGVLTWWSKYA